MVNRSFRGVWIPRDIWLNKELSITEKCFLAEIDSLGGSEEGCFASNQYFAEFFNLSKERARKIIGELNKKGYLEITLTYKEDSKEVDQRIIKLIGYGHKQPYGQNQPGGTVKNDHYITKSDNIIKKEKPVRHKYGTYKHVLLTDKDIEKLVSTYGKEVINEYIDRMDNWIELHGKTYKNYYLALINWLKKGKVTPLEAKDPEKDQEQGTADEEYFTKLLEEQMKGNKLG